MSLCEKENPKPIIGDIFPKYFLQYENDSSLH